MHCSTFHMPASASAFHVLTCMPAYQNLCGTAVTLLPALRRCISDCRAHVFYCPNGYPDNVSFCAPRRYSHLLVRLRCTARQQTAPLAYVVRDRAQRQTKERARSVPPLTLRQLASMILFKLDGSLPANNACGLHWSICHMHVHNPNMHYAVYAICNSHMGTGDNKPLTQVV